MKDSTWVMFNKRLVEAMAESNWLTLGNIYYEMADRVEKEGSDGEYLREQGYNAKLKHQQNYLDNLFMTTVEIYASDDACTVCKLQSGKVLPAEDARSRNPLPIMGCKSYLGNGCRCTYLPVLD